MSTWITCETDSDEDELINRFIASEIEQKEHKRRNKKVLNL